MDVSKTKAEQLANAAAKNLRDSSSVGRTKNLSKTGGPKSLDDIPTSAASLPNQEVVNWSQDAALFTQGLNAIKEAPEVRPDKVAKIKESIKNGTYQVDSKAVADKMLESVLNDELSQSQKD